MPEEIVKRLLCDAPGNDRLDAKPFCISDGRLTREVLLCPEHAEPLAEMMRWGRPAASPKPPRSGGLSPERLNSLRETPPDVS